MDVEDRILGVKKALPDLSFGNYELITDGYEKTVIITENKKVICILNELSNIKKYSLRVDLLRALANQTSTMTPTISYLSEEYGFFICEYIAGQRITPEYIAKNDSLAMCIGQSIGSFLKELHSLPKELCNLPSTFISDVIVDMEEGKPILESFLCHDDYSKVESFLVEYISLIADHDSECLVHADFHYNNIYWNAEKNQLGVIDFGESCISDPAVDFMWFVRQMPRDFTEAIFQSYGFDQNLVYRSITFDRLYGLYDIIENLKGDPRKPSFEKGYKRFFSPSTTV